MDGGGMSFEIALRWLSLDLTGDQIIQLFLGSGLVQSGNKAISWANVDPVLGHHMASLGTDELTRHEITDLLQYPKAAQCVMVLWMGFFSGNIEFGNDPFKLCCLSKIALKKISRIRTRKTIIYLVAMRWKYHDDLQWALGSSPRMPFLGVYQYKNPILPV